MNYRQTQHCQFARGRSLLIARIKRSKYQSAIRLIHCYVKKPWTVARLAEQVCMSRSAFASRFKHLVGDAPLQYLTRVRMRAAISLLKNSQDNLTKIAQKVGYESKAAFSKAFKRCMGSSLGEYKRLQSAKYSRTCKLIS